MGGGMSIEMWLAERDDAGATSELQERVFDELAWEPVLDAAEVRVAVDDGRVATLSGTVKSYAEKLAAERAARRVRGVQAVRNGLTVVLPVSDQRSDRELARAARQVLGADVLVPHGVRVTVDAGWVQLTGEVSRDCERRAAEEAVQRLVGVKGVFNSITVDPVAPPTDLKARVETALERNPALHRDHIKVAAQDGAVVLRGRVRSLAERDEAEQAVRDVSGAAILRDELRVDR